MIIGTVNDRLEAALSLEIIGPGSRQRRVDAVIDTGFSGFLTLPGDLIQALALPRAGKGSAVPADGSVVSLSVHLAGATWGSCQRAVQIDEANSIPLIGMAMLEPRDLHVQVGGGGHVRIERR